MSKLVKNLLVDDLKKRLDKVEDVVVVSLGRLDAQKTTELRKTLRQKKIHLQLVKNSLARRATLDTPLAPAFEKTEGMLAIAWGGEDAVDLAKELDRLTGLKDYEGLQCRGGAMDGDRLDAEGVKRVAKWPNRTEQLSILSGQISSLGSRLSGQILSAGGTLAGQISSLVEKLEQSPGGESAAS
jgi:ribosomal protein L10